MILGENVIIISDLKKWIWNDTFSLVININVIIINFVIFHCKIKYLREKE